MVIYVAEHIGYKRFAVVEDAKLRVTTFETIWVIIRLVKTKELLIGTAYRPPDQDETEFMQRQEMSLRLHLKMISPHLARYFCVLLDFLI